ncbi:hypothetical protein EON67_03720 [archaeon]|nr:MAG: hypothetical protein EON67_03720 [archaeon]
MASCAGEMEGEEGEGMEYMGEEGDDALYETSGSSVRLYEQALDHIVCCCLPRLPRHALARTPSRRTGCVHDGGRTRCLCTLPCAAPPA